MFKVLIVDFSMLKDSIVKMFKDSGYAVELCESAYDAIHKLNAADFDLYSTPAKNGATICGCVDGLFTEAFPIERTGLPGGAVRQITY